MRIKKTQKKTSAPARKVPKKRTYNNKTRAEKSIDSQNLIIQKLAELLIEKRGGEVQISEIAARSGVSQRTIFRFFKDKDELHKALDTYLQSFIQASIQTIQEKDVVGFAKNTYELFDRHENLTMAYLYSPFGQTARELFRKKLAQLLISRIVQDKKLTMSKELEGKLAVIVTLVNAKIWIDLRNDFKLTGKEMGEAVGWALELLIASL